MAYGDQCGALGFNCARLLYWANPTRIAPAPYPAMPMGVPAGTSTACTAGNRFNPPCDADDARTLDNTAFTVANFRQTVGPPLSVTSLAPSAPSPARAGSSITWMATSSGGTAPIQYKFLLYDSNGWTTVRDWNTSSAWTWSPASPGTYYVQVWARNAASNAAYDAWLGTDAFVVDASSPLTVTGLTSSPASGVVAGTSVVWSATASGGTGPYTYKFYLFTSAGWLVAQDWSSSSTWTWMPNAAGIYYVQVWARNAGSSTAYDAYVASSAFEVVGTLPLTVTGLTASTGSGTTLGGSVVWSASASGGTGPLTYKFYVFTPAGWIVGQDWSPSSTWTWTPDTGRQLLRAGLGAECRIGGALRRLPRVGRLRRGIAAANGHQSDIVDRLDRLAWEQRVVVCRDERGHRTAVVQVLRLDGLGLGRRAGLERVEHLDVDGGYARCVPRPGVGAQRGLHRDLRRLVREQRDRPEPGCVGRPLILSSTDRSSRKPTGPSSRLSLPMGTILGECRYALRQFWSARVFTATAVLTLALGIGGTTAIFTLIHAVMLRSLPVSDPSRLYRIGDGDNCCVQGGPQDRWGMFSLPLVERLKAETAGVRGGHRVPGGPGAPQRSPRAGRDNRPAAALRVRVRQLLFDLWRAGVRRADSDGVRRRPGGGAGAGDEPPCVADRVRRRPDDRRLHAAGRGARFHRRGHHAARVLR